MAPSGSHSDAASSISIESGPQEKKEDVWRSLKQPSDVPRIDPNRLEILEEVLQVSPTHSIDPFEKWNSVSPSAPTPVRVINVINCP